jgi:3'(2'), 5'-bisphosphate nucleotidase
MSTFTLREGDIERLIQIAVQAGEQILHVYHTDFTVENKEDQSPLTEADKASHHVIVHGLQSLNATIPIMSEEGSHTPYAIRKDWPMFWLVDPLDGTKEFIKKNGEFTVNIALIQDQYPVFGLIHVPVTGMTYVGTASGAYQVDREHRKSVLNVTAPQPTEITIVESRSHPSPELEKLMTTLQQHFPSIQRIEKGSSLKLCVIADGSAQLYPRLGPTMEWDIAAGQAIVEAAGGQIINLQGERFRYNKEDLRNQSFLAIGQLDVRHLIESP